MSEYLRISVRFLDGEFHGRGDGGEPEWPPSPLRLFQALVAASAAHWNERRGIKQAAPALRWLENLPPPIIFAAPYANGVAYRLYVPDNVGDLVGKSWSRGNDASIANFRTEKSVRPTRVNGDGAVHFVWPLHDASPETGLHLATVLIAARSITHLGWGVDLVAADAAKLNQSDLTSLSGTKWTPTETAGGTVLRIPRTGTLQDLERRHRAFLQRVTNEMFSPVPPLGTFQTIGYRQESSPEGRPSAMFALRQLDDSGFRSFDPVRRGMQVAAMLRHATGSEQFARMLGWADAHVASFVHGHNPSTDEGITRGRLMFLPLPSVEFRKSATATIGAIRRVIITTHGPVDIEEFKQCSQRLAGLELIDEKTASPVAVLAQIPGEDSVSRHYLFPSTFWATVTPVVLPGHDDPRKLRQRLRKNSGLNAKDKQDLLAKLDRRIEFLLRKAILHAGFSEELAMHAELEWRSAGYFAGTDLASRYLAGDQHRRYRKLHVRIRWRDRVGKDVNVPGPICIGSGKFSGCGLFAHA